MQTSHTQNTQASTDAPAQKSKDTVDKLYLVSDVAAFFQLKENTVYRWIRLKKIEVVRLGTRVRIPHREVERLVMAKKEAYSKQS